MCRPAPSRSRPRLPGGTWPRTRSVRVVLAQRVLPPPLRGCLRLAGPYGRAAAAWGAGDRAGALAALDASPRRLAAFSLAVDQPEAAAAALRRLPGRSGPPGAGRPPGLARRPPHRCRRNPRPRAWPPRPPPARQPRRRAGRPRPSPGRRDHDRGQFRPDSAPVLATIMRPAPAGPRGRPGPGRRILHLVTDALPTSQRRVHDPDAPDRAGPAGAGLDPHVVTRLGLPGRPGRRRPRAWSRGRHPVPPAAAVAPARPRRRRPPAAGLDVAARLTEQLRPSCCTRRATTPTPWSRWSWASGTGCRWCTRCAGSWRTPGCPGTRTAYAGQDEFYRLSRELETERMLAADLVVTLGEAMREEIEGRGVRREGAHRAERRRRRVPPAPAGRRRRCGPSWASRRASTSSARSPACSGTRASARCSRRRGAAPAACRRACSSATGRSAPPCSVRPAELAWVRRPSSPGGCRGEGTSNIHAVLDVFVVPRTADRVCQLVTPLKPVEAMASGIRGRQ